MSDNEETSPHRQVTRRSFLKTTAAAAGTTAVLAGAGQPVLKTLAADRTTGQSGKAGEQVFTCTCMWTCSNCQYDVVVRDGRVVKAVPKPGGDAQGSRMCLRGRSQLQRIYQADRIKYPMKRAGARGENKWTRISWDEAITAITDKWKADQEQYGKQSVAIHHASGNFGVLNGVICGLMPRLSNLMGMTDLDMCADAALPVGLDRTFGAGSYPENEITDAVNAKTIVVWGGNITAYVQSWQWLADAIENGTELVVVDPNFGGIAAKANRWFAPRPGADIAIVMGMMNYIISENLHDKEFLLAHTVAPVLINPTTKLYVRMSDFGVPPTEGPINPYTGQPTVIDPPAVWDLATGSPAPLDKAIDPSLSGTYQLLGMKVRTAFDHLVDEVNKYPPETAGELSELTSEQIIELAKIAIDGPVFNYIMFSTQAYPNGVHVGHVFGALTAITGNAGKAGASLRASGYFFVFDFNVVWPTQDRTTAMPILELPNVMKTGTFRGGSYPVKSLYVYSANPLHGIPDEGQMREEVLSKMELIVVVDNQFTDTARYADILLPSAHWYETTDVNILNTMPGLRISEQAVKPLYEAKQDADIARLLAEKMGLSQYFQMTDEEFMSLAIDQSMISKATGITYDRLRKEKVIRYAGKEPAIGAQGLKFNTPTGRIEFYCERPTARVDFGQTFDADRERLPHFFPPTEAWPDSENAKKYPLILLSERLVSRWHSSGFSSWVNEITPEPVLKINPKDAVARGIDDSDYVEAHNDRGHAVVRAVLDESIRPGIVMYPKNWHKFEFKQGGWSEMTSAQFDPVGVNSNFMDNRCEVRKWNGEV